MTDIKPDGIRPAGINSQNPKKASGNIPESAKSVEETKKEIDLKNDPTEMLGRSQVYTSKKNKINLDPDKFDPKVVADISQDLKVLNENPKIVSGSDKVFNHIYKENNDYSQAVNTQIEFVKELTDNSQK